MRLLALRLPTLPFTITLTPRVRRILCPDIEQGLESAGWTVEE